MFIRCLMVVCILLLPMTVAQAMYYDRESGSNYNNMRDYDSSVGRYIQSDPIGLVGGINTYSYIESNPLSRIDFLGLCGCTQTYGDCVQNCLQARLGSVQNYMNNLVATGMVNSIALTPIAIPNTGITGPAGQVIPGLVGRRIGGAIGRGTGRSIGGRIGAGIVGRGLIYGLGIAGAAAAGYGFGSAAYCVAICMSDNCYY